MPGDGMRGGFEPSEPPAPSNGSPFGSKIKVTIIVVCGLLVALICAPFAGLPPWGPVKSLYGLDQSLSKPALTGNNLGGTFRFYWRLFGSGSSSAGGACLIGDIAKLLPASWDVVTAACTPGSNDQCNPEAPLLPTFPTPTKAKRNFYGYCVPEGKNKGRCWYKPVPDQDVCVKDKIPWRVGTDHAVPKNPPHAFDVRAFYAANTGGRPAQWRLVGHLNIAGKPAQNPYGQPEMIK